MPHWKSVVKESKYLASYHLPEGSELYATIDRYERKEIIGENGRKSVKTVIYFTDKKVLPMILNVTNAQEIADIAGTDDIDKWRGVNISIFSDPNVTLGKKRVGGLRVRNPEGHVCESCGNVITSYKTFTAAEIEEKSLEKYQKRLCGRCCAELKKQKGNP